MVDRLALTSLLLAMALVSPAPPGAQLEEASPVDFSAFAREVLFGYGTPATPLFDDYTEGSYHVEPAQLAADLQQEARRYGLDLRTLVVVGPFGPLWAYEVVAFVQEQECARVNRLLVPHARITAKHTGCLSPEDARRTMAAILAAAPSENSPEGAEVGESCILVADYASDPPRLQRSLGSCHDPAASPDLSALEAALEPLAGKLQLTYGHPPDPTR